MRCNESSYKTDLLPIDAAIAAKGDREYLYDKPVDSENSSLMEESLNNLLNFSSIKSKQSTMTANRGLTNNSIN